MSRRTYLEENLEPRAHGGFDVQNTDVLPVLFTQRHQKIDGNHDVGTQIIVFHVDVTDRSIEAQDFFHLKFNLTGQFRDFGL